METRNTSNKARVTVYTRPNCHLCEEAKKAIKAADCDEDYTLDEVNIENDPELLRRYRYDIPVITINGVEAFRQGLTSAAFREQLLKRAAGKPPSPTK
jgi:glutaredoxin